MSMLGEQIKELREAARNIQGKLGRGLYRRKDVDEMQQVSGMLFEAADTIENLLLFEAADPIENLRDKLQAVGEPFDTDSVREYDSMYFCSVYGEDLPYPPMLRVKASETHTKDESVREAYELICEESASGNCRDAGLRRVCEIGGASVVATILLFSVILRLKGWI